MKDLITVSFPGFGIDDFSVSKIALRQLPIVWLFIISAVAILGAVAYGVYLHKKKGKLSRDEWIGIAAIAILGIGIGVVLCFFDLEVRWYGIFVTLGMVTAVLYTFFRAKRIGVATDDLLDLSLFT